MPVPALLAVLAASLVGVLDENIQAFLPNRAYDIRDVQFNVLASVMAVGGEHGAFVRASLALKGLARLRTPPAGDPNAASPRLTIPLLHSQHRCPR